MDGEEGFQLGEFPSHRRLPNNVTVPGLSPKPKVVRELKEPRYRVSGDSLLRSPGGT